MSGKRWRPGLGILAGFLVGMGTVVAHAGTAQCENECGSFRRGDANGDGQLDMSDGIATLGFLFLGGLPPGCDDAADADDSGEIEITDAIYSFSYLFIGGPAPPAPGPFTCGFDPTSDGIFCCHTSPCIPERITRDFSAFEKFSYRYEPLCGLSLERENQVITAIITRQEGDEYWLASTVLKRGDRDVDDCLVNFCDGCWVAQELPSRLMNEEEVKEMLRLFSEVEVSLSAEPNCRCYPQDPDGLRLFQWDGEELNDNYCMAGNTDGYRLEEFLQRLVDPE